MKKALSSISENRQAVAITLSLVVVGMFMFVPELAAQLPTATNIGNSAKSSVAPLVRLARFALAAVAVFMGIISAFGAARKGSGGGTEWVKVILLFIIAGIAMSPGTFLSLLGMGNLCSSTDGAGSVSLEDFGVC